MKENASKQLFDIEKLLTGLGLTVLRSIRDPFGIIAPDYTLLWLNKSMGIIHGKPCEDASGKICYKYFYDRKQPCNDCPLNEVFATGKTHIAERYLDFPDGKRRWGEVKAYPVRGEDNSLEAAIVIVFDITDRKNASEKNKQYTKYLFKKLDAQRDIEESAFINDDISIMISLTKREREVLHLLIEGHTNIQISDMLIITPNTVKSHVINIFNKLGVSDRTQAAVMAIRYNLV